MKVKSKTTTPRRYSRFIFPTLIGVQLVVTALLVLYVCHLQRQLNQLSQTTISRLIIDAADGLNRPVERDVHTGRAYIYEQRLMLPVISDTHQRLSYAYSPPSEDSGMWLRIVDETVVGPERARLISAVSNDELFAAVPKFQACIRGYELTFERPQYPSGQEILVKMLSDGRTLYVYHEDLCANGRDKMIGYLQQIDSY